MSGSFNQDKPSPAANGWHIFTPQHAGGKFDAYKNQLVIIIPGARSKASKHAVYFTDAVIKKLENPKYIVVMTRGQVLGFMKSETSENAYKVSQTANDTGSKFLNLSALLKKMELRSGVYIAAWQDGVLTVDTMQIPSKL